MKLLINRIARGFYLLLIACSFTVSAFNGAHQHSSMKSEVEDICDNGESVCAKTMTSAFAPNGDLWRVWALQESLYYQISKDNGVSFSAVVKVAIPAEKISARNENRPKIAFDQFQGVYLSWAMPREKKYTADVRFSYSADYGKTFSLPVTVNNDNLLAGHSFNEMLVTANGDVSIVWLDGRVAHQLRKQGKETKGSNLYIAKANIRAGESFTSNQSLANDTCVCCRIAMDFNQQQELAIFWRHIYGDNIREFALLTINADKTNQSKPIQISDDHWQINGCPHQGGGISIDDENRYHLVWFNLGDKGKGIYYASSTDQGSTLTKPLSIGNLAAQAAHPHIMQHNTADHKKVIDIVWTQFNGTEHQLWHQQSKDNGKTFLPAKQLASSTTGSDRPFIIKKQYVSYVSWQRPKLGHVIQAL